MMSTRRTFSTAVFLFALIPFAGLLGCSGGDDSTTSPGTSGTAGTGGAAGTGGSAGTSGTSGTAGSSGTGGTGGSAGTSGSECTQDSDCLGALNPACVDATCEAGVCNRLFKDQGTAIDDPTPGDCHSATCDGAGGITLVANGTDTPAQTDGDCKKAVCGSSGEITNSPDISDVPPQVAGDCHVLSCSDAGEIISSVDDSDPTDDGNSCTTDQCTNGDNTHGFSSAGTSCNSGASVCDGNGQCGVCLPGATSCDNGIPQRCSSIGQWEPEPDQCNGLSCNDQGCIVPTQVAVGAGFTCSLLSDGTVRCWGTGNEGELGLGANQTVATSPTQVPGLTDVVELAGGGLTTCVRRATGEVLCWGYNMFGAVGNGTPTDTNVYAPGHVMDGATALYRGSYSYCARTGANTMKCWGDNINGQLALPTSGPTTILKTPVDAASSIVGFDLIQMGARVGCGLNASGAKCWGTNENGEIPSTAINSLSSAPVLIAGTAGLTDISASTQICGVKSDAVVCWGKKLTTAANGTESTSIITPTTTSLPGVTHIDVSPWNACAWGGGIAYCWGRNTSGELGLANANNSAPAIVNTPTLIPLTGVSVVSTSKNNHSCVIANNRSFLLHGQ
ncbi:MAG: hypothetical protein U0165_15960 [Polyangiaceae bacterium]